MKAPQSFIAYFTALTSVFIFSCANIVADPTLTGEIEYVLELFTSQGCASCPPADRLLGEIARARNVVALSFSVDYWDYIGWKDTLAAPFSLARQKAYGAMRGDDQIYSPQIIVNGLTDAVGSNRPAIEEAIRSTKGVADSMSVSVRLSEVGDRLHIEVAPGGGGPAGIYMLRVLRSKPVHIGRGENAGRTVTYTNVVRAIKKIGDWTGSKTVLDIPNMAVEEEGYIVLLQRGAIDKPGAILGAAKGAGL
jgi:hypothetical protein